MKPTAILIGLVAGAATALLFAGVILQSPLAIVLSLAAPLPIFIASLGWGSAIGFVAAAAAGAALAGITGSPIGGALLFTAMALPAAVIGHIAGLAKPAETAAGPAGALEWFPVARILFAIALVAALACLATGWMIGYDSAAVGGELGNALAAQVGGDAAAEARLRDFAIQLVRLIPFLQPALLTAVLAVCLYLAAALARLSGKLARPRDDLPTAASALPKSALAVFAAALALSFLSGTVGLVASVVAGSFGMAFTLAGLANIHRMTRATRSRGLILFALYMAILILTFPLVVGTVIGLSETAKRRPLPPTTH